MKENSFLLKKTCVYIKKKELASLGIIFLLLKTCFQEKHNPPERKQEFLEVVYLVKNGRRSSISCHLRTVTIHFGQQI